MLVCDKVYCKQRVFFRYIDGNKELELLDYVFQNSKILSVMYVLLILICIVYNLDLLCHIL